MGLACCLMGTCLPGARKGAVPSMDSPKAAPFGRGRACNAGHLGAGLRAGAAPNRRGP